MPFEAGKSVSTTPKLEGFDTYPQILAVYEEHRPRLISGEETMLSFYDNFLKPLVPAGEQYDYQTFRKWHRKQIRKIMESTDGKTLMEKEMVKLRTQHEIRQDVTQMMAQFIKAIKDLASDPAALATNNIKVTDIYKIIREEEDRAKAIGLKERAENRADAQFAFMVSVVRAGVLTEDDIAFLEEDVKNELISLKQENGTYQLPTSSGQLEKAVVATANRPAVADEGNRPGA